MFVIAFIIDTLIESSQNPESAEQIIIFIFLLIGIRIVMRVINEILNNLERSYIFKSVFKFKELLATKFNSLSIGSLEQPEVANLAARYGENLRLAEWHIAYLLVFIGPLTTLVVTSLILIPQVPFAILLITISSIPAIFVNRYFLSRIHQANIIHTTDKRIGENIVRTLMDPAKVKGVILINGFDYLRKVFTRKYQAFHNDIDTLRFRWTVISIFSNILNYAAIGYGIYLIYILVQTGNISIGAMAFYITLLNVFNTSITGLVFSFTNLSEGNIKIREHMKLLELKDTFPNGTVKLDNIKYPPTIKIENATFAYPDTNRFVIKSLNLKIKPGEKIAIVGENGAGKTTLLKLLIRLYQLNEGFIEIDSVNIKDIYAETWYKQIGILFQDFNIYPDLSVVENIVLGNVTQNTKAGEDMNLYMLHKERIDKAVEMADAKSFIEKYPNKFNQVLSESYKGGIRPSGGQWQKIALARVFFRNAPVLILDEPTSSIDAEAEAKIFDRIYEFTTDKTVIIVSHRFSTVRNADRIIVLDSGKILEQGTHDELLKLGGRYAKAFKTQAKGYV